ncbi:MAG: hypothetical protein A2063_05640 [Gallionellales bacterium GWA2_60_142]|nr:MAG: hypothetical protein A2063_05640 [Gallionellales bacterium GWA2_60_142]
MFCLMSLMRPRTYVELGTHYGASFFAVCQAIEEYKIDCFPVAIDLWVGDKHAGYYQEDVYSTFKWIHQNKYSGVGSALRKDFSEAAQDFEAKSIDLIHIDGLHTYEAVKNDYETWLPKVTENGVLLFHDTAVRERGFGVWELWDEIKDKHASFNFTHTHGLGIIALGRADTNPIVALLEIINSSKGSMESFDNFFKLIGERVTGESLAKNELERNQEKFRTLSIFRSLARHARSFLNSR